MNNRQFELLLPSKIIFGAGSVESVGSEAKHLACQNALIVTSHGMRKRDAVKKVIDSLNNQEIKTKTFY
jgi:alcohol dehydrogenase class IV